MKDSGKKRPGFLDAWNETPTQAAETREETVLPERLCVACRIPMKLLEQGYLVTYEDIGLGVRLSGFPYFHKAEVYICPQCGRYDFFRPVMPGGKYDALEDCRDETGPAARRGDAPGGTEDPG
ncbi:MAG: hypothetical protein E7426_04405 [Ruminococcaceae bacterium]|nr:hypothetical protein [Oscillospiraceae bacterium]